MHLDTTISFPQAYFYFAPRVIKSQEHYLYDFDTLIAEIGGYVGLLLGFSFAHLLGWFNALFERTVRTYEEAKRSDKKDKEEEDNEGEVLRNAGYYEEDAKC